jgi:hypothetical protein
MYSPLFFKTFYNLCLDNFVLPFYKSICFLRFSVMSSFSFSECLAPAPSSLCQITFTLEVLGTSASEEHLALRANHGASVFLYCSICLAKNPAAVSAALCSTSPNALSFDKITTAPIGSPLATIGPTVYDLNLSVFPSTISISLSSV